MNGQNGRVTLAILGQKIDNLHEKVSELGSKIENMDGCREKLEKHCAAQTMKVNGWIKTSSWVIGLIVAGLIGIALQIIFRR